MDSWQFVLETEMMGNCIENISAAAFEGNQFVILNNTVNLVVNQLLDSHNISTSHSIVVAVGNSK